MGDIKCRKPLNAMREIYLNTVLNVKTARDKCPPPINDPNKTAFKVEDMLLLKNKHAPRKAFDSKMQAELQNL